MPPILGQCKNVVKGYVSQRMPLCWYSNRLRSKISCKREWFNLLNLREIMESLQEVFEWFIPSDSHFDVWYCDAKSVCTFYCKMSWMLMHESWRLDNQVTLIFLCNEDSTNYIQATFSSSLAQSGTSLNHVCTLAVGVFTH